MSFKQFNESKNDLLSGILFDVRAWKDLEVEFAKILETIFTIRVIFDVVAGNNCARQTLAKSNKELPLSSGSSIDEPSVKPQCDTIDEKTLFQSTRVFLDRFPSLSDRPGPYQNKVLLEDAYTLVEADLERAILEASEESGVPVGVLKAFVCQRFFLDKVGLSIWQEWIKTAF